MAQMITPIESSWVKLSLAGGVCVLLGIGLSRFAYSPFIPALADAQWFSSTDANHLGAVNLFGYLLGAMAAHQTTFHFGARRILAVSLTVTVVGLYAGLFNWGFAWYAFWRFACGLGGAFLTVIGVSEALARIPRQHRPAASSLIFSGIGLGIAASGTVVPWLIRFGVAAAWGALGGLGTVLGLWAWLQVWRHHDTQLVKQALPINENPSNLPIIVVSFVLLAYGLDAVGFVPHTLFWVDYIAHELNQGLTVGGAYWIAFGLGAIAGPFVVGMMAHWLGFRLSLTLALLIKMVAVLLPLLSESVATLLMSSVLVGLLIPGTVALTSGSITELVSPDRQQQTWGWATLSVALMQAIAGYGMSQAYVSLDTYRPIFAVAGGILLLAALCAAIAAMYKIPH